MKKDNPHLIVIMDEAFSDLSVVGKISTNTEVTPFISSIKKDVISGYALASVYGGNTANSEYEFLTGNSMAWLQPNTVPYQQYLRSSTYSAASYLKSHYGYRCIAMHPYLSNGWNRPNAYRYLGFDESFYVENFPQRDYIRQFISDREMFEKITDIYETRQDEPLFMFGVSMQNHGGYSYSGDNYNQTISLVGYDKSYPEVEQYLSLIHETDKAVEYLISYFEHVDDDIVIVFFGDHQPKLDKEFYSDICENNLDSLDEKQDIYKVPFFIWSNYDIDEKYIECTSLNYLSSYMYEVAGISLPPYNRFLSDMEKVIPSLNTNGFYSMEKGEYLSFDMASENEEKWMKQYRMLQFNSLFDNKNRNRELFPNLE
jgi:phosphoglycerol transferase MdoB-like AlkP superfamily enzyme